MIIETKIKYIDDGDEIKVFEKEVYSARPKGKYLWQKRLSLLRKAGTIAVQFVVPKSYGVFPFFLRMANVKMFFPLLDFRCIRFSYEKNIIVVEYTFAV